MITSQVDKQSYQGNGSNVNFAIPFTIVVNDIAEVGVILRDITTPTNPIDTVQAFGTNFTMSGGSHTGPIFNTTVVMNVAPSATQIIVIYRIMPLTQLLNMLTSTFDYSNLNIVHDRIVAMAQVLNEMISRVPILAQATQVPPANLAIPEPVANTAIGFNSAKALVLYAVTAISNAIATLTGDVTSVGGSAAPTVIQPGVVTLAKINAAAYSAIPAASVLALFDANQNLSANNLIESYATTVTAAATTTLIVSSAWQQFFTGVTTQNAVLPVAATMTKNGMGFFIVNNSSGVVTVKTSGGNTIKAMAAGSTLLVICINTAGGTGTASWNWQYIASLNN